MTTYNTGNPIGSKDPRDLYDNAENLDEAVNTRTAESWDDRFGVARKTWWGMEQDFQQFLINSGYENIGDYGPGLEITARNQIFWRDGELYRAGAVLELPYTTTGDWGDEESLFVAVGDQALRQELSNAMEGARLIPNAGISSQSIPRLAEYTGTDFRSITVLSYRDGGTSGGGEFYYDPDFPKNRHDGGIYIDPQKIADFDTADWFIPNADGSGCFVRTFDQLTLSYYGVYADSEGGSLYNTLAFESAVKTAKTFGKSVIYGPEHGDVFWFSDAEQITLDGGVCFDGNNKTYRFKQMNGFLLGAGEDNWLNNLIVDSDHIDNDEEIPSDFYGVKIIRGNKEVNYLAVRGFHIGLWFAGRQNSLGNMIRAYRNNINVRFGSDGEWSNFNFLRNSQTQFSYINGIEAVKGLECNNFVETTNIENHFRSNDPSEQTTKGGVRVHPGARLDIVNCWTESDRWLNEGILHVRGMQNSNPGPFRLINKGYLPEFSLTSASISKKNIAELDPLGDINGFSSDNVIINPFSDSQFFQDGTPYLFIEVGGSPGQTKSLATNWIDFRGFFLGSGLRFYGIWFNQIVQTTVPMDDLRVQLQLETSNGDRWNFDPSRVYLPPPTNETHAMGGVVELNGWPEPFNVHRVARARLRLSWGFDSDYSTGTNGVRVGSGFVKAITQLTHSSAMW